MSTYRRVVRDDTLIRERRKWWFWWTFNRSEEDQLTMLLNRKTAATDELRRLKRIIPKMQDKIDKEKKAVMAMGGTTHPFRDSWFNFRREPKVLSEPGVLKKKLLTKPVKPAVLASLVVPNR